MSYYDTSYPPSLWEGGGPTPPADNRGSASPGDTFTEPAIVGEDVTNANKLSGLGFVADPTTPWVTGQRITVSGFAFSWDGTAWDAGAVP